VCVCVWCVYVYTYTCTHTYTYTDTDTDTDADTDTDTDTDTHHGERVIIAGEEGGEVGGGSVRVITADRVQHVHVVRHW
jgi:hypothetical protein